MLLVRPRLDPNVPFAVETDVGLFFYLAPRFTFLFRGVEIVEGVFDAAVDAV